MSKVLQRFQSKKMEKIQSRSWQLIIPAGWDNLESIKERCRGIARNYYFILHDFDKNELGEPVAPHWHLLMTFAAARRLDTMQNYFKEWGNFEKEEKETEKESEAPDVEIGKSADLENQQQLRSNSFERVYSIDGARKYLVHAEDPNKYQYSPLSVETNDKLFINLFLPKADAITETKNLFKSFKSLCECETFTQFLSMFEEFFYKMPPHQRVSNFITLRSYYRQYKIRDNNLFNYDDGFDKLPPKDDGFTPVSAEDLPF